MSIAASGDGLTSSEDEGAVGLPPQVLSPPLHRNPELTAMLARAAGVAGWRSTNCQSRTLAAG